MLFHKMGHSSCRIPRRTRNDFTCHKIFHKHRHLPCGQFASHRVGVQCIASHHAVSKVTTSLQLASCRRIAILNEPEHRRKKHGFVQPSGLFAPLAVREITARQPSAEKTRAAHPRTVRTGQTACAITLCATPKGKWLTPPEIPPGFLTPKIIRSLLRLFAASRIASAGSPCPTA